MKDPLKQKRIFVGFNSAGIAGIYAYTRILRRRGYQIDFYGINQNNFEVPVDFLLQFSCNRFISFWERIFCFFRLLPKYDIWHFNYMEAFFFYPLNLLILKLLGKKIIVTFRGSEVRTQIDFLPRSLFIKSDKSWPEYYEKIFSNKKKWLTFKKRLRMKIFCRMADKVALTGPFLISAVSRFDTIIPYAREVKKIVKNTQKNQKNLTVLHVPTEPIVKGTKEIEKIFKKLTKKYPNINFKILPVMSRKHLLEEMLQADIIVDQIIIGWYGGQAVEAMAMGKTVMAFINPIYLHFVDFAKEIPIYNTSIWTFEKDLEFLIENSEYRKTLGQKGIQFAKKIHHPEKIADQYLKLYKASYEQ